MVSIKKRTFTSKVKKLGYIVKDYSQDKEYKYEVRLFISDKEGNNLVFMKSDVSIFKDVNSINFLTKFDKSQKSYSNKYELLQLVIEFCEAYENELDEEFRESIEDYQDYLKTGKLSINDEFNI